MAKFCMKKIVLALAGIGLTGTALASITPNSAFSSPTPVGYGWHIAGLGDWIQPSSNNLQYSTTNTAISTFGTNGVNFNSSGNSVEPDSAFGWGAEIGYQFAGTMDDLTVSGTRFDNDDTDTAYAPANSVVTVPGGLNFTQATGKATISFTTVDLEFGHTECIGNWIIRPYAGVDYASIGQDLDIYGSNQYGVGGNSFTALNSAFHGVGPEIGVNAKYQLGNGFGVVGSFNGELLVGNETENAWSSANVVANGGAASYVSNNTPDEEHTVVPGADAKAGLSYDLPLNAASCLTLEAGYEVAEYFHAASRPNVPVATVTTTSVQVPVVSGPSVAGHSNHQRTRTVTTTTVQFPSNFTTEDNNQDVNEHGPFVSVGLKF